jgi:hypothetical protein
MYSVKIGVSISLDVAALDDLDGLNKPWNSFLNRKEGAEWKP